MFANILFLEIEIIHVYAPGLLTAAVGTATVIWQTKNGIGEIKTELKAEVSRIEKKMGAIEKSIYIMNSNILTVAREATGAMATKNLTGMHALAARIKRCQESGGKDCK
jgi:hypothetical protein